ncbi:MAG: hypothetical protein Q8Q20_03715 [bacterium]|nr:hypothetical protein [bacterium]
MNNNKGLKIGFIALIVAGGFFITRGAQALTLIPPSFETSVDPGKTFDTQIKLYNEGQEALELYPEVVSFTAEGETGRPTWDFEAPREGVATWFEIQDGPVIIEPGERLVIPVQITPPADAEPGGHYATVFFGTEPPDISGSTGVAVGTKLGSLFLLRVFGDVEEAGSISEFGYDGNESRNRLPVTFFTRFENTGNIHLRPEGNVTVKNLFGRASAVLPLNPTNGATLPDTIRRYETVWENTMIDETDGNVWTSFWTEFGNEWRNFALGRYSATVELEAGNGGLIQDSATTSLWVWPWRVLTLAVLVLALLVLLLIFILKKYNSWIINRARGV